MFKPHVIACLCLGLMASAAAFAQAAPEPSRSRGALLYTTHCIACHSTQMHWRDQRVATDWAGLKAQVRRWQGNAQLDWNEDDIVEVARYLNTIYYGYPQPNAWRSSAPASVLAACSANADIGIAARWTSTGGITALSSAASRC